MLDQIVEYPHIHTIDLYEIKVERDFRRINGTHTHSDRTNT